MASAASPHAASAGASPRRYEPRCAEANLVRRIVEEELDGFLAAKLTEKDLSDDGPCGSEAGG